jgi:cell division septation protein DedD/nucleoid DNA-binding protein
MNIEKYIRELLFEQNCVIIPDFGGFIANYVSADIHPIRHTFIPPSKNIAFNEMLKVNDGLLVSNVANAEQISREDAMQAVRDFVEKVRQDIRMTGKYRFEDIGTLYLNHEQRLQFEPENTINYLTASFGLPDLQFKPIERQTAARINTKDRATLTDAEFRIRENLNSQKTEKDTKSKPASQSPKWQSTLVPAGLFLAIAFGYFNFLDKGDNWLSKINPFALVNKDFFAKSNSSTTQNSNKASVIPAQNEWGKNEQKPEDKVVEKEEKKSEEKTVEKKESETVKNVKQHEETKKTAKITEKKTEVPKEKPSKKERFYIIVGGFGSISNAEKLKKELSEQGHAAKVLPAGNNGLIKVSYDDYATESEANSVVQTLKSKYPGAWVYKN